jgi:RHH-type proline utilization regulon transcriptional repressor/proline dehydrogenase/delta 1-pyrroline-5-carboxylate dehydrogenase
MTELAPLRARIAADIRAEEATLLRRLIDGAALDAAARARIAARAAELVRTIRARSRPGMMEVFLDEYGLSTDEGIALMCLAEALLRVPDAETIDALIEDKISASDWGRHLGQSTSPLVNASTWALMLTGKVLSDEGPGIAGTLKGIARRLGEPVIRTAVSRAMKELGRQFVLGRDISEARARAKGMERKGYTYSYDMLGEAAMTERDAQRYHLAYAQAISSIAGDCTGADVRSNPGISVKLSALHPRYEESQSARVMRELVPRLTSLATLARSAGIGFNIDAEEAARLDLSLDVIAAVATNPSLAGWDGFGVVVQAYGRRAGPVLDWLHGLAGTLGRRLMVRLVKGAYWDSEVKRAQVEGLADFPVFTRKQATDVSYIANARKLLGMADRIYPQFATHNAHTVAAILDMGADRSTYEFQRLHGMGEALHDIVHTTEGTRCRIYAPVGAHRDLLAYLVRRLLENGANSSFVNQILDAAVPPEVVAACPFDAVEMVMPAAANPAIAKPSRIFGARQNSRGWDLTDRTELAAIETARAPWRAARWQAHPLLAGTAERGVSVGILNPSDNSDQVGTVTEADAVLVKAAAAAARPWNATAPERAAVLRKAADLYEAAYGEIFAMLAREAGKTLPDAVAELREAVDFLRFYADEAKRLDPSPRGVIAAISPWNFPLAIFTGQVAAGLAAGNAVLAKPAEATPLIAFRATELLHQAGVPLAALQFLPGRGPLVGAALASDAHVAALAFTGSTATARAINRSMANSLDPDAVLIAETGGLNAMIVDSTALPEQAVRDIVNSAFRSAGQRCSALRVLYVQEDIAETVEHMLLGALDELSLGDPWELATDIGPVIDARAQQKIAAHIEVARAEGRLVKALTASGAGTFVGPAVIRISGIGALTEEIFGPVLHIARFRADRIDQVVADINASGFGLTFGLHTRIDDRVQHIVERIRAGNIYVNRNQIGAVVGSQPFGGEGLSGTGPKAGGPHYLSRFAAAGRAPVPTGIPGTPVDPDAVAQAIAVARRQFRRGPITTTDLPGPTGESNRLSIFARGVVLCLGPGRATEDSQVAAAEAAGCAAVRADGLGAEALATLPDIDVVAFAGSDEQARPLRRALAARTGRIVPLVMSADPSGWFRLERHVCIDTTASGGNAALLSESGQYPAIVA